MLPDVGELPGEDSKVQAWGAWGSCQVRKGGLWGELWGCCQMLGESHQGQGPRVNCRVGELPGGGGKEAARCRVGGCDALQRRLLMPSSK